MLLICHTSKGQLCCWFEAATRCMQHQQDLSKHAAYALRKTLMLYVSAQQQKKSHLWVTSCLKLLLGLTSGKAIAASQMAMIARDRTLSSKSCRRSSTASSTCKHNHGSTSQTAPVQGCWAAQGSIVTWRVLLTRLGGMCVWGSGVSPQHNRVALVWAIYCNIKQHR